VPRKRVFQIHGQVITAAEVRQWMQSVGARVPENRRAEYVRQFAVVEKIARAKVAGDFLDQVQEAARRAGVKVRAARRPGTLARVRSLPACNEPRFLPPP
jgi:hypothetical protein